MRLIDFQRDQIFYSKYIAPSIYRKDFLDIYRFNLVVKILKLKFKLKETFRDETILNIGGGYGREAYLMFTYKPKAIIIVDYSFNQLAQADRYLKEFNQRYLICADGERLPFKDKSVDICVINEALHHFINPLKGFDEFIRVTKKIIILDEPFERKMITRLLDYIFVLFRLKEKFERGYLEAFRINRDTLRKISADYKVKILYYPYFIYYFQWYKNTKIKFIRLFYQKFLAIINIFFHFFGNRAIVSIELPQEI